VVNFVEIYKVCARKVITEAAKRIVNSDTVCHSYSELNFGVTFFGTQCTSSNGIMRKYNVLTIDYISRVRYWQSIELGCIASVEQCTRTTDTQCKPT